MKKIFSIFLMICLLSLSASAYPATDTKISDLPSATTLQGTETLPIVQGGATKKATIGDINTYANGHNNISSATTVTGISNKPLRNNSGVVGACSYSDITGLWTTCSGYLKSDGTCDTPSSMVYPGAGIPLSTGSAWGTSVTNNSSNWNTAYGWGNHASGGYLTPSSIASSISDSDTTHCPDGNSVYDALAGKQASGSYLTSVASDSDWTVHGSYPAACSAGQYVSALGDTNTCSQPGDVTGTAANASQLLTGTWAIPGTIGSTTPNTGVFTGLTVGSNVVGGNETILATLTSIHTFTNANWNEDAATWTMAASGPLVHVAGNTTTVTATNTEAIVAGTTYKVTITGTGSGGTTTYTLGGVTGTTIAATGAIAITDYITASTTASLIITPASACTVSIPLITIQKLTDATGDLTVEGNLITNSPFLARTNVSNAYPQYSFYDSPTSGMSYHTSALRFSTAGSNALTLVSTYAQFSGAIYLGGSDLQLWRNAADSLSLRRLTNPQTFSLYETYTDASNYEMYSLVSGSDALTISALSAGTGSANLGITITPKGTGATTLNGATIHNNVVRLKGYTVATLPSGTQGDTAFVTDALAPTFLATIVAGGAVVTPVFYNGTNWVGY